MACELFWLVPYFFGVVIIHDHLVTEYEYSHGSVYSVRNKKDWHTFAAITWPIWSPFYFLYIAVTLTWELLSDVFKP